MMCQEAKEADIRHALLFPLLQNEAHCAFTPPTASVAGEFSSVFYLECPTGRREHKRGRKPQVDYVIIGQCEEHILYRIPVEAKIKDLTWRFCQVTFGRWQMHRMAVLLDQGRAVASEDGCKRLSLTVISPTVPWRNLTVIVNGAAIASSRWRDNAWKKII